MMMLNMSRTGIAEMALLLVQPVTATILWMEVSDSAVSLSVYFLYVYLCIYWCRRAGIKEAALFPQNYSGR